MCYSTVTHCKVVSREPSALIRAAKVSILLTEGPWEFRYMNCYVWFNLMLTL